MDHYHLLQVTKTASKSEIKKAYLKLAKILHPDVNGNDSKKAELFKQVNEAYAVLIDPNTRREYDRIRAHENFNQRPTDSRTSHPYANTSEYAQQTSRPLYGIDEAVWYAHHYGEASRYKNGMPTRYYGMNIVEERIEREQERFEQRQKIYQLKPTAAYFMRHEKRLRDYEEKKATETSNNDSCLIS